ncbi:NUDIX hydrolase domain-like protein [Lactifluus volemus]|nr:NUDIX hydrolase domain-like protein [Lactifluus volemus]
MSQPKILSIEDLDTTDAKWVSLKKINWQDQKASRVWEAATRRTRAESGVDAVAILALIRSKTRTFPLSTVIVEQFRPPMDKFVVELPAGLIDEGETPERAAIRELQEETGYAAEGVLESSAVLATDPGMTTANMKLVVLDVPLDGEMVSPDQDLQDGEVIVRRAVELKLLYGLLKESYLVDARLLHLAAGFDLAERLRAGDISL